jgi:hypothetical protein
MRTLLEVKTEIAALLEECGVSDGANGSTVVTASITKNKLARNKNRIEFLRIVEKYLEDAPDELYLGREIARLENRITKIVDSFDPTEYKDPTEPRKEYEKEMGIPHLRLQLRTLRFIKK